MAMLAQG